MALLRLRSLHLLHISALVVCWLAMGTLVQAEAFRVESKVFINGERIGASETLTLFDNGRVYDFIFDESQHPVEVTIYDVKNARFYLLDVQRELRTEVNAAELVAFSSAMKLRVESESSSIREMVIPTFEQEFNAASGKLELRSPRIVYEVQCEKAGADEARQYNRFADWYARLNATRLRNPPPFARLDLNEALAQHEVVPRWVQRTYKPANRLFGKPQVARTEHVFSWRLLETDRDRMAEAQRYQGRFKQVDFGTFRNLAGAVEDN